jgi:hypothetical protein
MDGFEAQNYELCLQCRKKNPEWAYKRGKVRRFYQKAMGVQEEEASEVLWTEKGLGERAYERGVERACRDTMETHENSDIFEELAEDDDDDDDDEKDLSGWADEGEAGAE